MSYELRTYTAAEGKMNDLLRRFQKHTMALFEQHRMTNIGYWIAASDPSTLVYLIRHEGSAQDNWASFAADPAWISAKAASIEGGELVARIDSVLLTPTDFSPLQN
ncbi:MAG: NIPSNAP family protein [Terrimesophilobacter sp.]